MGVADQVWGDYPVYYKQPIRWLRYHAHTKPHFFWSIAFGLSGPLLIAFTPLRKKFIYDDHVPVPQSYPLEGPRDKNLTGYDD
ncbi:putative NADH-ubiquinone oxidoreductase 9.5 kDa subunit [[Candida] jaroonii]|uniref:NADH-ubiquinone oxidoreductase 9.5 kDa subunit n=1 Tax=[Candida] jaroonii TaxID=467808 RepID=A0ACA9YEJ6_9ASCO|nr:putative NADH-ubiquinone oxidoreductase 9.5 kDa subunit [[Candida] jaroonii]